MTWNSCELKYLAIEWVRFTKRASCIATECGYWASDVIGLTNNQLIEIETKISVSDLRIDKKKYKHSYYKSCELWVPNLFYFLVPDVMEECAIEESRAINSAYGVIVAKCYDDRKPFVSVAKRAKALHLRAPTDKVKADTLFRMSSELCSFHKRRAEKRRGDK